MKIDLYIERYEFLKFLVKRHFAVIGHWTSKNSLLMSDKLDIYSNQKKNDQI